MIGQTRHKSLVHVVEHPFSFEKKRFILPPNSACHPRYFRNQQSFTIVASRVNVSSAICRPISTTECGEKDGYLACVGRLESAEGDAFVPRASRSLKFPFSVPFGVCHTG